MTVQIVKLIPKPKTAQLVCSQCFAKTNAACDCGVAYISAKSAAINYYKKHPEMNDAAIAKVLGVNPETVRRGRLEFPQNAETAKVARIGKDGKSYPAYKTKPVLEIVDSGRVASAEDAAIRTIYNSACYSYAEAKRVIKLVGKASLEKNVIDAIKDAAKAWNEILAKVK